MEGTIYMVRTLRGSGVYIQESAWEIIKAADTKITEYAKSDTREIVLRTYAVKNGNAELQVCRERIQYEAKERVLVALQLWSKGQWIWMVETLWPDEYLYP